MCVLCVVVDVLYCVVCGAGRLLLLDSWFIFDSGFTLDSYGRYWG